MNIGIEKAQEAAQAVGGFVAIPELGGKKCDFNDLYQQCGEDAVKCAIANAVAPVMGDVSIDAIGTPVGDVEGDGWPVPQALEGQYA